MFDTLKHRIPAPLLGAMRQARARSRQLVFWHGRPLRHELSSGISIEITSASDWAVYNEVFVDGEYDEAIRMVVGSAAVDPYVLDLGANVGYFALRFSDRWRRERGPARFQILCVEGSPRTYAQLTRQVGQPAIEGRCLPVRGLVGRRTGSAAISTSALSGLNSIYTRQSLSRARVPFVDLEQLVPRDRPIALVKCDIEGAEQSFFESYPELLGRVEVIVVELHHELCDAARCRELLRTAGLPHRRLLRAYDGCSVELFARGPLDGYGRSLSD